MTNETIARYLENGYKGRKNAVSSRELERTLAIPSEELAEHGLDGADLSAQMTRSLILLTPQKMTAEKLAQLRQEQEAPLMNKVTM